MAHSNETLEGGRSDQMGRSEIWSQACLFFLGLWFPNTAPSERLAANRGAVMQLS